MQTYQIFIWALKASMLPDVEASTMADDPLEATFAVMRAYGLTWAYFAWVHLNEYDGVGVAEYSEFACPEQEVC